MLTENLSLNELVEFEKKAKIWLVRVIFRKVYNNFFLHAEKKVNCDWLNGCFHKHPQNCE